MSASERRRAAWIEVSANQRVIHSVLTALNEGRVSDAVDEFGEPFTFIDHGLQLIFMDKARLTEYFQKSRELFPDAAVEADVAFEHGDRAIAEWKLTATNVVPFGTLYLRDPVHLRGISVVQLENGKITRWSDFYDGVTSRRSGVAAFFEEWTES